MIFIDDSKFRIHACGYGTVYPEWSRKIFGYPHNILYYVTDGGAKIWLKNDYVNMTKGNIYLLSGHEFIETRCHEHLSHYFVHFQCYTPYHDNVLELYDSSAVYKVQESDEIEALFETMILYQPHNSLDSYFHSMGSLQKLIGPFFKGIVEPRRDVVRFLPVLAYINEHLSERISLSLLAGLVNLETTYFAKLFTNSMGISPKQYIIKKRIKKAKLLLVQTDKGLKEIAWEIGMNNEMYFSRCFKDKTGLTPGAYRQVSK